MYSNLNPLPRNIPFMTQPSHQQKLLLKKVMHRTLGSGGPKIPEKCEFIALIFLTNISASALKDSA